MISRSHILSFYIPVIKAIFVVILFTPVGTYSTSTPSASASATPPPSSVPTNKASDPLPAVKTNAKAIPTKEIMINWSRQLGVTCIHCHNLDNFNDDSKLNFKIALKHHQMVKILQQEVFVELTQGNALKVKVDCFMCHRGKERPNYIEPPFQLNK